MKELLLSELRSSRTDLMHAVSLIEQEFFAKSASQIKLDMQQVNDLVILCQQEIESIEDPLDRAERLIELIFVDNLFIDHKRSFWHIENHQLESGLGFRCMAPALKHLFFVHLIRCCGFECAAVYVPDDIMIRIVCDDDYAIIFNTLSGEAISWHDLEERLSDLENQEEHVSLDVVKDTTLISQYLISLKTSLIREQKFDLALECVNLILGLNPEDPYHRRDRGFLLQQLDCYKVAFDDYRFYVDKCPKDPEAKILQLQLDNISQIETVLH